MRYTHPLKQTAISLSSIVGLFITVSNPTLAAAQQDIFYSDNFTTDSYEAPYKDYLPLGLPRPPGLPTPPLPPRHGRLHPRSHRHYFKHGPSLYGGYTRGGDTLMENSGSDLHAGDAYSAHLGWHMDFPTGIYRTALQWSIGYRKSELDDSSRMTAVPLDGMAFYQNGLLRVGGGFTYHLFPTFTYTETDIFGERGIEHEFENQLGIMASMEIAGVYAPFFLNFRFTYIEYKPKNGSFTNPASNETVNSVNGSHFGMYAGFHFY